MGKEDRERMAAEQLVPRGIKDKRVIDAFLKVPREDFVPEFAKGSAYYDCPLAIGEGQTISQPYMVAATTELLELEGKEKVLEIGTGSGYQAAILSELTKDVVSVERIEELAEEARKKLEDYDVKVVVGDGTKGWEDEAPYDGIIVTAGAPKVPEPLKEQLADGGRLVIPVGSRRHQNLMRITRKGDDFEEEVFFGCVFVPLKGEFGW